MLSQEDVQEIVGLLDDLNATELHLRTRHYSLWLRRSGEVGGEWAQASSVPSTHPLPPPPEAASRQQSTLEMDGMVAVRAPLMGTFYRAPKPGAPPYVAVGSLVEEDTVVGIVETMKLMNSVYAGARGRVAEICLGNDQPAEQGAVLMWIEPS